MEPIGRYAAYCLDVPNSQTLLLSVTQLFESAVGRPRRMRVWMGCEECMHAGQTHAWRSSTVVCILSFAISSAPFVVLRGSDRKPRADSLSSFHRPTARRTPCCLHSVRSEAGDIAHPLIHTLSSCVVVVVVVVVVVAVVFSHLEVDQSWLYEKWVPSFTRRLSPYTSSHELWSHH